MASTTSGQIVGEADANSYLRAFLKDPGQPMQDLGDLGGGVSRAWAINNAGQVVGRSDYDVGSVTGVRAFLKNPGQAMENLGTLGDGGAKPSPSTTPDRWREVPC